MRSKAFTQTLLVLFVTVAVMTGCGEGEASKRPSSGSDDWTRGEPRFEILSTWEPSLVPRGKETHIGYSFIIANRGSSSGEVSCHIWMSGERLPGTSESVTIDPGEEVTVEGSARTERKPADFSLVELTPRCE